MANSDKNILITPNRNLSDIPQIALTGAGNSSLFLRIPDSNLGTLNFESGTVGLGITLFSVDSSQTSTNIFTSYSLDGIPSIDMQKEKVVIGNIGNFHNVNAPTLKLASYLRGSFPNTPEPGMIIYDKTMKAARCYNGKSWTILSEKRDGLTPETAAESASQILYNYPDSDDGAYWYQTPEMPYPIETYTDMRRDGGGWIMISRWGGSNKTYPKIYSAETLLPIFLRRHEFLGASVCARLSRRDMNCLWNYSYGTCRIHFNNLEFTATGGIYFQRKVTNLQNFDLWKAHYNPLYWSDNNEANSYQATGGGTYYEVAFANNYTNATDIINYPGNANVYNPFTNDIIGGTASNANMGWWDKKSIGESEAAGLNESFIVARHMGFFGDINQGNQWILTNNPDEPGKRFPVNENRETMVFLRT